MLYIKYFLPGGQVSWRTQTSPERYLRYDDAARKAGFKSIQEVKDWQRSQGLVADGLFGKLSQGRFNQLNLLSNKAATLNTFNTASQSTLYSPTNTLTTLLKTNQNNYQQNTLNKSEENSEEGFGWKDGAKLGLSMIPGVGLGMDAYDFYKDPSWENAGWLAFGAISTFFPWLRGAKAAGKLAKAGRIGVGAIAGKALSSKNGGTLNYLKYQR